MFEVAPVQIRWSGRLEKNVADVDDDVDMDRLLCSSINRGCGGRGKTLLGQMSLVTSSRQ